MLSAFFIKDSSQPIKVTKMNHPKDPLLDPHDDEHISRSDSFHSQTKDFKNQNSTLGSLTKKFVQLIKSAPSQIIQIDEASQLLNIQKRRIYDITNVLEGIGYIQKLGKNLMRWVGGLEGSELEREVMELSRKQETLQQKTKEVQNEIFDIQTQLKNLSDENARYNYLMMDDVRKIMKAMQVRNILIYAGGIGDQMSNDGNPQKKILQCTLQSNSTLAKIFYCKLNQNQDLNVIENPSFHHPSTFPSRQSYFPTKPASQLNRQPVLKKPQCPLLSQQSEKDSGFHSLFPSLLREVRDQSGERSEHHEIVEIYQSQSSGEVGQYKFLKQSRFDRKGRANYRQEREDGRKSEEASEE